MQTVLRFGIVARMIPAAVTEPATRRWAALIVGLAVLVLSADALKVSATRLTPGYDEVSYIALGRQVVRDGGVAGTVRCYVEGRCREDNHPPLYQMLLSPFMDDSPASFARAKLVELALALLVVTLVFAVIRRRVSAAAAFGAASLLCLMPVMADYAARIMHDVLYVAFTFATVHAIVATQERGAPSWFGVGALVGLAFLTKGSGHLLWAPLVVTSLYRHRAALFRRPGLYAAAAGFLAISSFFLWRNWKLWHEPFYNVNAGEVWLDRWRDIFLMRLDPQHAKLGLGWYLRRHSLLDLLLKLGKGAGQITGVFIYTAGVGFWNPVARVITGLATLALAGFGLRRRWRDGARIEVVAVLSTLGVYFAALALAATGAPGPQVRFVFPYVVLVMPYAALESVEGVWPCLRGRLARGWASPDVAAFAVLATVLVARLALAAPAALRSDPRTLYAVEPRWHETSEWLSRTLQPGERFSLPYMSRYSTFDVPRPDVDPRWAFWFGVPSAQLQDILAHKGIDRVLIDTADVDLPEYAAKLGPEVDAHGPLAFLDWPRCFADGGAPSRFLVYCRPSSGTAPAR